MSGKKQNTFIEVQYISEINDSKINCFILIHCSIPLMHKQIDIFVQRIKVQLLQEQVHVLWDYQMSDAVKVYE